MSEWLIGYEASVVLYLRKCWTNTQQGSQETSADSVIRSQTAPADNFNSYIWENVAKLVPQSLDYGSTASQQFFELAMFLFRSTGDAYYGTLNITNYVHDWSDLLLRHEHKEVGGRSPDWLSNSNDEQFVGRDQIDWIVFGLSSLLNWSFHILKSLGKPLGAP